MSGTHRALLVLILVNLFGPVWALECSNGGAAPAVPPDDTNDSNATACGGYAIAGGDTSTAMGFNAQSTGFVSVALGYNASSAGDSSTALGASALSAGIYSTALGYQASSPGPASTALGNGAYSTGSNGTALGYESSSVGDRSTALGFRAYAGQPDTVILGSIAGLNGAGVYSKIGIGTSAPEQAVDVERSSAAARLQLTSFTQLDTEAPQYIQRRARGTSLAPTALLNGDNLGLFSFRGYNGSAMGGSRATITAQAAGNFTGASTPTRLIFATTPVGSTTPQQVLVITPDGKVQVNGVNLNVPDYVFEDEYDLMPLDELRSFINTHGHLPGIAPAHEVQAAGLDLAGSHMSHLQKIEELTLYTLQQQERIQQLEAQQERLAQLDALQQRVAHLETLLEQALASRD